MSQLEIKAIISSINAYLSANSLPWFIKDFQSLIEERNSKTYSKHKVRKIMIEDARLSFKKISSQPPSYSSSITVFDVVQSPPLSNPPVGLGKSWSLAISLKKLY